MFTGETGLNNNIEINAFENAPVEPQTGADADLYVVRGFKLTVPHNTSKFNGKNS